MRHRTKALLALVPLIGILALSLTTSSGEAPAGPGDPVRGHKLVIKKCTFCHYVEGRGGMIAPPLEKGLALADALVRNYEKRIADLKVSSPKAYSDAALAIETVLAAKDPATRFELWLNAYLKDTKFDNPMTKMGNVILSPQERSDVIAWLISRRADQ